MTLAVLIPIYVLDYVIEDQVSKNTVKTIQGCIVDAEINTSKSGINSIGIEDEQGSDIQFATYDRNIIVQFGGERGTCYRFLYYRHSFLIPNIGRKWFVGYEPLDIN